MSSNEWRAKVSCANFCSVAPQIVILFPTLTHPIYQLLLIILSFPKRYEYLWADNAKFKKPTPLPAVQYVSHLMDWTEAQINNENVFPTRTGKKDSLIRNLNANSYALLFFNNRCSFSEKFCQHLQEDLNPIIPSLRPRVHSSL